MPKIVDHDEYRRELLEKCFSIITRKGYARVTMREIAAEIGVSTGTLYHYFPTKESIMEQLFGFVQETNVGEFLSLTQQLESIDDKLDIFVEKWKEFGNFYQNVMLLSVDVMRNMKGLDTEEIFVNFSDYYTAAMAKELGLPEEGARALFVYLLGIIFHSMLTPRFMPYDRQIDILRGMLEKVLPLKEKPGDDAAVKEGAGSIFDHIASVVNRKEVG